MAFKSVKEMKEANYKRKWYDDIIYYGFYIWWNKITDLKWQIPNLIERAYYGVGYADVWDFDIYLSKVIVRGLKHLKKVQQGVPSEIYQKYAKRKNLTQKQKDNLATREWNTILDIIIRGFELVPDLFETKVLRNKTLQEGHEYEFERSMKFFKKYYFNLWD